MKVFKDFIIKELVLTFLIAVTALVLFKTVLINSYFPVFWILLIIISGLTGILHYNILKVTEKEASKFTSRFLMVTGIKMMMYLIFITSYVLIYPESAKVFLIFFLVLYLIYTSFEVFSILTYLKK